MIAIVDYGMGNVRSMCNALEWLGYDADISADPAVLHAADRIILPGVGAFGDAMDAIRASSLDQILDDEVRRGGKPMLGVCLGMQLLANSSEEHGKHQGLGWIDADIERFQLPATFKVPHVGWNSIQFSDGEPLFRDISPHERNFYFVHSFHMRCKDPTNVIASTDYGGLFTAAVRVGNVMAVQFHPEKSQDNGLRVLQNFLEWNP